MSGATIGWLKEFALTDPSSWVPAYGNFCGPDYSDGHRLSDDGVPTFVTAPTMITVNGKTRESEVDGICKLHDIDYVNASGKPNENQLLLAADLNLLARTSELAKDWKNTTLEEKAYSALMYFAFAEKVGWVDIPRAIYEYLGNPPESAQETSAPDSNMVLSGVLSAARMADSTAHGGVIMGGAPTVLIGGQPAARLGDPHICAMFTGLVPHVGGVIVSASSTVLIAGAYAARVGDLCGCGGAGASGAGVPPVIGPGAGPRRLTTDDKGRMDADLDRTETARGPHAEAELADSDQDGDYDAGRAEGSAGRMRNEGHKDVGPVEVGGQHNLDVAYVRGEAVTTVDHGLGANASAEVGMVKEGAEISLGPASDEGRNPFAAVGGEYDLFHAEAKGDILVGDDGKRIGVGAMGKAGAEVLGGKLTGRRTVPVPFTGWNIQVKGEGSGTLASAGAGLGGWVFWDRQESRLHLGALGEIAALAGVELNFDISVGQAYQEPPPAKSTVALASGIPGVGAGGIPNPIVIGCATVLIG